MPISTSCSHPRFLYFYSFLFFCDWLQFWISSGIEVCAFECQLPWLQNGILLILSTHIIIIIRYAMSKKLAHLILSSSVCKSDNFDSGYSCYCCLFVPCPWVSRSFIHFVKDVTISVCGVMGLAQVVACVKKKLKLWHEHSLMITRHVWVCHLSFIIIG
jgi:hypothetical protein